MTIPAVGLGTYRLQGQQAIDSITTALELGYRHIDTAQFYANEVEVGKAIAASGVPRKEIFITTKVWHDNLQRVQASLQESLDRLQLDQVDLALIHWPSPNDALPVSEYVTALAEAQAKGMTRLIGVSNFTIAHLSKAVEAIGAKQIACNQIEVHPFLQNRKLTQFTRSHGIAITAYMPMAVGAVSKDETIQAIATHHGCSPGQVALAWSLQQGNAVIPSSTQRAHLQANLDAQSIRLSEDEMNVIAKLERGERIASPPFAPKWD